MEKGYRTFLDGLDEGEGRPVEDRCLSSILSRCIKKNFKVFIWFKKG